VTEYIPTSLRRLKVHVPPVVIPTMYVIAQEDTPRDFKCWAGPFPHELEALELTGTDGNSVIIVAGNEQMDVKWRWRTDRWVSA
jgi:hypothetical protein